VPNRIGQDPIPTNATSDFIRVSGHGSTIEFAVGLVSAPASNNFIEVLDGGKIVQVENGTLLDDFLTIAETEFPGLFDEASFGIFIGTGFNEGRLLVSGVSAVDGTSSMVSSTGDISVGGGQAFVGFNPDFSSIFMPQKGEIVVEQGAALVSDMQINVSAPGGPGTGTLTVRSGGTVEAQQINIYDGGLLNGDGGTVIGNIFLDGGTIAPGDSPGTLTVLGNADLADGLLQIEIDGSLHDVFEVVGDISLGSDLEIELIFGFDPDGMQFDLTDFLVGSITDNQFDAATNLRVTGAPADATFSVFDFNGQEITFGTATAIPEPSTAALGTLALVGLIRRRRSV